MVVEDGDCAVETPLLHSPRPVFLILGKIRYVSGTFSKSFGRELLKQWVGIIADMHEMFLLVVERTLTAVFPDDFSLVW